MSAASYQIDASQTANLVRAREQLHSAAKLISRVGALAPPKADYSHVALTWSQKLNGFVTAEVSGGVQMGLELAEPAISVLRGGEVLSRQPLSGLTHQAAAEWMDAELARAGVSAASDLPKAAEAAAKLPSARLASGGAYECNGDNAHLFALLHSWFALAERVLTQSLTRYAEINPGPSALLCWPHHFDIATLITLDAGMSAEEARSVGLGMSPGDDTYAAPYFYVNPWPKPPNFDELPPAPPNAEWHTEDFFSLLMHAEKAAEGAGAEANSQSFIASGAEIALQVVGYR